MAARVAVYGRDRCDDTEAVRNNLDSLGVQFDYVDVDRDEWVRGGVERHRDSGRKTPTVEIDGHVPTKPDERELETALRGRGLMG
jgi:glutaredoxin